MENNSVYFNIDFDNLLDNYHFYITTDDRFSELKKKHKGNFHHYFYKIIGNDNNLLIVSEKSLKDRYLEEIFPRQNFEKESPVTVQLIIKLIVKAEMLNIHKGSLSTVEKNYDIHKTSKTHLLKFFRLSSWYTQTSGPIKNNILHINASRCGYYFENEINIGEKETFLKTLESNDRYLFENSYKFLKKSSYTSSEKNANYLDYKNEDDYDLSLAKFINDVLKTLKKSKYIETRDFNPHIITFNNASSKVLDRDFLSNVVIPFINEKGGVHVVTNKHSMIEVEDIEYFKFLCSQVSLKLNGIFDTLEEVPFEANSFLINIAQKRKKRSKDVSERELDDKIDKYSDTESSQNITVDKFEMINLSILSKILTDIMLKIEILEEKVNDRREIPAHCLHFFKRIEKSERYMSYIVSSSKSGKLSFLKNDKIRPQCSKLKNQLFLKIGKKDYRISRSNIRNVVSDKYLQEQFTIQDSPHPVFSKIIDFCNSTEANNTKKKESLELISRLKKSKELKILSKVKIKDLQNSFDYGEGMTSKALIKKKYNKEILTPIKKIFGVDLGMIRGWYPQKSRDELGGFTRINYFEFQGDLYYKTSSLELKDYSIANNASYIKIENGSEIKDIVISLLLSSSYCYTFKESEPTVTNTNSNFADSLKYLNEKFFSRETKITI